MMTPLHDRVLVEIDETIPTNVPGLIIPIKIDAWRGKGGSVESYNRGTVVSSGPGKKDPKTLRPTPMYFDAGDCRRTLQLATWCDLVSLNITNSKRMGKDTRLSAMLTL